MMKKIAVTALKILAALAVLTLWVLMNWNTPAHSQTIGGQLHVQRLASVNLDDSVETNRKRHKDFLVFAEELERNLHRYLDGRLASNWKVTVRLVCSGDHKRDRLGISARSNRGLRIREQLYEIPKKPQIGEGTAEDLAKIILRAEKQHLGTPQDAQPSPSDPTPGRRAQTRAGALSICHSRPVYPP